jgi:tetratricopeptide (TPR) repeat protein
LHTPEAWGGDVKEAIKAFQRSIELYEASPEKSKDNWFYLDTIAFLGKAYEKDKQQAKAIETYEKAIRLEPGFAWVKYILLPQARKNIAAQ